MEHLRVRMPVSTTCSARGVPGVDWLPAVMVFWCGIFLGFVAGTRKFVG